jgi:hypothetical protein
MKLYTSFKTRKSPINLKNQKRIDMAGLIKYNLFEIIMQKIKEEYF